MPLPRLLKRGVAEGPGRQPRVDYSQKSRVKQVNLLKRSSSLDIARILQRLVLYPRREQLLI